MAMLLLIIRAVSRDHQKTSERVIVYEIIEENGPDHSKEFVSQVRIDGKVLGAGAEKVKGSGTNSNKALLELIDILNI